jgi:hypothetical protein
MTTNTTPTYLNAFVVEEFEVGPGKTARRWTKIGAAFPHKEGSGLNIELKALPLTGRLVLLPPDIEEVPEDAKAPARAAATRR